MTIQAGAKPKPSLPHGEPRDPGRILGMMHFMSVFGAGIVLGVNWRRLGKPEWVATTVVLAIAIPLMSLLAIFGGVMLLADSPLFEAFYYVIFLGFGVNVGFVWGLSRLQGGAYKKYKQQGVEAMLAHEYDFQGALLVGLLVVLAVVVMGFLFQVFL